MLAYSRWGSLAAVALALAACGTGQSDDVNQERIYQVYRVQLDDASQKLEAKASFHYESSLGTSLNLTSPSSVEFAGQPMRVATLLGMTHYEAQEKFFQQSFAPQSFRYVNNAGEVFTVQAPLPPTLAVRSPADGTRIQAGQDLVVRVQSEPLGPHQEVKACLHAESYGVAEAPLDECLYLRGASTLVFSREQLEKFHNDSIVTLRLTRTHNPPQNNQKIQLNVERRYKPINLYF